MILLAFKFISKKFDEYMDWKPWLKHDKFLMWFLLKTLHISLGVVLAMGLSSLLMGAILFPAYMALTHSFLWLLVYLVYAIDVGFACTYEEWKQKESE